MPTRIPARMPTHVSMHMSVHMSTHMSACHRRPMPRRVVGLRLFWPTLHCPHCLANTPWSTLLQPTLFDQPCFGQHCFGQHYQLMPLQLREVPALLWETPLRQILLWQTPLGPSMSNTIQPALLHQHYPATTIRPALLQPKRCSIQHYCFRHNCPSQHCISAYTTMPTPTNGASAARADALSTSSCQRGRRPSRRSCRGMSMHKSTSASTTSADTTSGNTTFFWPMLLRPNLL